MIVGLIYLVVAPIAGVAYAIIQVKRRMRAWAWEFFGRWAAPLALGKDRRQLYLSGVSGVPNSLVRLDANGAVVEDLSEKQGEGVWVEIGAEVLIVEVFG